MRDYESFMLSFRGYSQWDDVLRETALQRLLRQYIADYDKPEWEAIRPDEFRHTTYMEIEEDIRYYESMEMYEICHVLKDLQEYL